MLDIRMKWYYRLGFLLLLFIVIYIFFRLKPVWVPVLDILVSLLIPFMIGAFITYLLHPVVEHLHGRGMHRGLAVFIIYSLFFVGVGFAVYKGIPVFIRQLRDLAHNAPVFAAQYREWMENIQNQTSRWPFPVQERIESSIAAVELALEGFLTSIMGILIGILNSIVIIAIIPFIAFYMLKDFELIRRTTWYLTPSRWRDQGKQFLREVDHSLGSYIRGQLLVCLIIGLLSAMFFSIAGMRYSLLLGLIVGVTNVIPYFGPFIGAVPAVVIAATMSFKMVLICMGIVFSLQFLEGNVLSPLIVGKSLHIHPLVIMFALLAGGKAGGIAGLVLAVPLLVVLRAAIYHARDHLIRLKSRPVP